jgi:tetratricopeptide (TPR) repeat protein
MDREELSDRIRILKESGRYSDAEEEIRHELEKTPEQSFLKTSLVDLYLRQGRSTEARILIDEVLSRDPQHPEALSAPGDLFIKQRSPQRSLDCYRKAFARDHKLSILATRFSATTQGASTRNPNHTFFRSRFCRKSSFRKIG